MCSLCPTLAPENCDCWYVLSPVPHLGGNIDWNIEGPKYRDKIVSYLEQKKKDDPKLQHFVTELYGLNTTLEYPKLYDKFMSINIE